MLLRTCLVVLSLVTAGCADRLDGLRNTSYKERVEQIQVGHTDAGGLKAAFGTPSRSYLSAEQGVFTMLWFSGYDPSGAPPPVSSKNYELLKVELRNGLVSYYAYYFRNGEAISRGVPATHSPHVRAESVGSHIAR